MWALLLVAVSQAKQPVLMPSPDALPRPRFPEPPPLAQRAAPAPLRHEPAPDPKRARAASGSANGHWGYAESGLTLGPGTLIDPGTSGELGIRTSAAAGWGFQRGGVRIVPSAAISWSHPIISLAPLFIHAVSPVDLRVAAPDLLSEKLSRLRLTPVLGFTLPTLPGSTLLTLLSLGAQLERRFGPVEVAYRAEAGRSVSTGVATEAWYLFNRLLAEGWLLPSVSAAVGFGLLAGWPERIAAAAALPSFFSTTVQLNFAVDRHVGVGFSMDTLLPTTDAMGRVAFPFYAVGAERQNLTTFSLRLWLRSHERLQRNWLDR